MPQTSHSASLVELKYLGGLTPEGGRTYIGIRGPADRESAGKSRVQPATWPIFAYIHSATAAKLWIYLY